MEIFGLDMLPAIMVIVGGLGILAYLFYWISVIVCSRKEKMEELSGSKLDFITDFREKESESIKKKSEFFDMFISRAYIDLNKYKDELCSDLKISREQYDLEEIEIDKHSPKGANVSVELLRWAFNDKLRDNGYVYLNKPYDYVKYHAHRPEGSFVTNGGKCMKCEDNINVLKEKALDSVAMLESCVQKECEHVYERYDIKDVVLEYPYEHMLLSDVLVSVNFCETLMDAYELIGDGRVSINGNKIEIESSEDSEEEGEVRGGVESIEMPKLKANGLVNIIQINKEYRAKSCRVTINYVPKESFISPQYMQGLTPCSIEPTAERNIGSSDPTLVPAS